MKDIIHYDNYEGPKLKPIDKMLHSNEELNKQIFNYYGYLQDIKKKYNYSDNLISLLTLIQISLNDLYGKKINDIFYKVLSDVEIIIKKGNTNSICKKLGYKVDSSVMGLYTNNDPMNLFTPNLYYPKDQIIMGTKLKSKKISDIDMTDTLIHELRHALTSYLNTNKYINKEIFYKRSGISEYYFFKDEDEMIALGMLLDEVFNVYFTDVLINNILNYKNNYIDKANIRKILSYIKYCSKDPYESTAYDFEVALCKPLLVNKDIIDLANHAALTGEMDQFKDLFNDYDEYVDLLDELSDLSYLTKKFNDEEREDYYNKIKEFKKETLNIAKRKI